MQALVSIAALVPPPLGYTPPRPAMPPAFKAGFFGAFFNESCFHTGFLFYDDTVRKLRTDWMIGDCADTVGFNLLAKTDINDANAGRILNYYVPFNTTSYACNIIPLENGNWWQRDYLAGAQYLGQALVAPMTTLSGQGGAASSSSSATNVSVLTDVFNSTGQFLAGYVLTYLPVASANAPSEYRPLRMEIWQGPHENYYQSFTYFNPSNAFLPAQTFDIFPTLACAPQAKL